MNNEEQSLYIEATYLADRGRQAIYEQLQRHAKEIEWYQRMDERFYKLEDLFMKILMQLHMRKKDNE